MRCIPLGLVIGVVGLSGCYLFHIAPGDNAAADTQRDRDRDLTDAAPVSNCAIQAFKAVDKFEPIDMVWVVDSSQSMQDEQARIRQTINQFVMDIEARAFDVHLVMITRTNIVPPPLGADAQRYLFVQDAVGSTEPLTALIEELPRYRMFLRDDAALHFVVVTDDDSSMSADEFLTEMREQLAKPFVVHAVASPDVNGRPCMNADSAMDCMDARGGHRLCGAAAIGRQYYALAERLGGAEISICVDDWSQVFGPLLAAVGRTEIPCVIDLPASFSAGSSSTAATTVSLRRPNSGTIALREVPDATSCGTDRAFYYVAHAVQRELVLCPSACADTTLSDVELRVAQGCATSALLQ